LSVTEATEQLSAVVGVPKTTPVAEHTPGSLLTTTSVGHAIVGEIVSDTVTVEEHVDVFPEPSVTVKVTVFGPTFAQVKAVVEADRVTAEQLSVDPLSISAATIVPAPAPSKKTVMS
jgi:hypothetical protein